MSGHEPPAELQLKPILSYPREAQVGKTYLVSVDVQLATPNASWDFPEEEYTIGFILNTSPYFTSKPLHDVWPTVILHRYGGTYGPAEFLLTAADSEIARGQISITLVNGWGIPMTKLELPCEVKAEIGTQEAREIVLPPQQEFAEPRDRQEPIQILPEEQEEREWVNRIAALLEEAGWLIVKEDETITNSASCIKITILPHSADATNSALLLLLNSEAIGIVMKEGEHEWLANLDEALMNSHFLDSVQQSSIIQAARDPLPFIYEMQGEEIHFTNNLEPDARSRIVFHFHRPETFALWLEQAPVGTPNDLNDLLRSRLRRMPPVAETNIPASQAEAITKLEDSLAQNRPRALIQMSDSTSTILKSIYRLLAFGGARRVLYLVDNLNDTSKIHDAFQQYIIPDNNQHFIDLYTVRNVLVNDEGYVLMDLFSNVDSDELSEVWVMRIEDVYRWLSTTASEADNLDNEATQNVLPISYQPALPIEQFDAIFVVECLDDLPRRYRPILDYFDAFFVGVGANIPSQVVSLFDRNVVYQEQ